MIITEHIEGLTITIDEEGSGELEGTLKEICPEYNFACAAGCKMDCRADDSSAEFRDYNLAMDGIESLLLAMACEGINLENNKPLQRALETAMESCANNL